MENAPPPTYLNLKARELKIELCVKNTECAKVCRGVFEGIDNVVVREVADLSEASGDCICVTGDSMGGCDVELDELLGKGTWGEGRRDLMTPSHYVQSIIGTRWAGEMPVGVSAIFPLPMLGGVRYLVYSPVVRDRNCEACKYSHTRLNTYLAFRGALLAALDYSCKSVSCGVFYVNSFETFDTLMTCLHMREAYTSIMGLKA